MTNQFTPGEWVARKQGWIGSTYDVIALDEKDAQSDTVVVVKVGGRTATEAHDNANLLAASKHLLEACLSALDFIQSTEALTAAGGWNDDYVCRQLEEAIDEARKGRS